MKVRVAGGSGAMASRRIRPVKRGPRKMLKLGMLALALLLGGAIVNVAVAWGCARNSHLHFTESVRGGDLDWWGQTAPALFRECPPYVQRSYGFGREYSMYPPYAPERAYVYDVRRERAGWPALALETSLWFDAEDGVSARKHALPLTWIDDELEPHPILPIWPGFAINTIFYASILWLLFLAPGKLKRIIRRRRGLCPACAYPIRTSEVCTECGKAVTSIKVLNG